MNAPSVVPIFLLGAIGVLGGVNACKTQATPAVHQEANLTTVVIPVEGMSCVSCAARIKKRLASMNGVGEVEVSLGERHARVRFDPSRVSADRLAAAINDLGYHAGAPVAQP